MITVHLYAEDRLCEAFGLALVRHADPSSSVVSRVTGGFGRIRTDLPKYERLSKSRPVLILVDLDRFACPPALLEAWGVPGHASPGMAFRIAVRECESWLMADADAVSARFGVSAAGLPPAPDELHDPKESFLSLLRAKSRGRRALMEDVLPEKGSAAKVGLGYNDRLTEFVRDEWSIERAAERSGSLARAVRRVRELVADDGV